MVKTDYSRDYYADLGLSSDADLNEIKKQFRKLAFQHHPDRNPGREAEANAKFQTIQTAHEILSSPESKAKYDANRARASRFPGASGVRGNPWQNVGKDFPPPPRRGEPPNTSYRASASAARYAKFPNTPPPPPPRPADKDDAQSRADAFESMRAHTRRPAPTAAQPSTSNPSGASPRPRPTPEPRQTAYTASQQKKAEASFGTRTPRASRSGFVPQSPMGDEGPVTSKHYATKRHTSLFDEPAAGSQKSYAADAEDDGGPRPYLDPRSSPYGGVRGEKLDPFDGVANLGRARSTRDIPRKPVGTDQDPFVSSARRQRSFSVSDEPDGPTKPSASAASDDKRGSYPTGRDQNSRSSSRPPNDRTTSRFGERYTPKTGGAGFQGNDDSSSSGASATATVGADNSYSTTGKTNNSYAKVYDVSDPSVAPSAFPFEADPQPQQCSTAGGASGSRQRKPPDQKGCSGGQVAAGSTRLSSGSPEGAFRPVLNKFERKQFELLHQIIGRAPDLPENKQSQQQAQQQGPAPPEKLGYQTSECKDSQADLIEPTSYPTPGYRSEESLHPNVNQSRFTRNSADNINTRFVAEEHSGTNWHFSAGSDGSEDTGGSSARRTQSQSGNRGRRSPPKTRQAPRAPGGGGAAAAAAATAAAAAAAAGVAAFSSSGANNADETVDPRQQQSQQQQPGFDADEWKEKIGSEHFIPVPPPRGSTSPTRAGRTNKRRPTVRMAKGGTAGLVDDDETTSGEEKSAGAPLNGRAESPNAMDIDPPMGEAVPTPPPNGVRPVPLEPTRPEWRAGDANGFTAASPGSGASPTPGIGLGLNLGSPQAVPPLPPKIPATSEKPRFNASNAAGSEDTDDLGPSFAEFKKVEPLAERATGLGSFDDLKTNLPFESKASSSVPIEKPKAKATKTVNFPKAPVPPRLPPALAIPSLMPSRTAWDKYVVEFEVYLRDWDVFNAKFVDHVLARQNNMNKLKQKDGLAALSTRGDEGVQEYYTWLEEDKIVHEKWTAYTTEHYLRVREFMAHRDKMKMAL